MRVLVSGSRDFADWQVIWSVLDGLFLNHSVGYMVAHLEPFVVIEGEAKGADTIARMWVENSPLHGPVLEAVPSALDAPDDAYVMIEKYPADWNRYKKGAGPIRNKQMLDEGKPDVVWAFTNRPLAESSGTKNMVTQARAAGVKTYVVEAIPNG